MGCPAESSPSPPPQRQANKGKQRSMPAPFLTKTYQLVDDPSLDDGSGFFVWRLVEFASDVLPKHFKRNNFSSFLRQLDIYRSRKIAPGRWEFAHEHFRRGEKRLLCQIHRRKLLATEPSTPPSAHSANPVGLLVNSGADQVISSTSSFGGAPEIGAGASDLKEEKDQLRRENKSLCWELNQMKSLCNHILQLVSRYAPRCQHNAGTSGGGGGGGGTGPGVAVVADGGGRVKDGGLR